MKRTLLFTYQQCHQLKITRLHLSMLFMLIFLLPSYVSSQTNVALGKRATQSSNYTANAGQPANAVDGNNNGNWHGKSVTHTSGKGQKDPWWSVDLGEVYQINKIQIWNRTDCCQGRLDNFRILIKEKPRDSWSTFTSGFQKFRQGQTNPLTFKNKKYARYVMVQLKNPNGILSLAEVQVYGKPLEPLPTVTSETSIELKVKYAKASKTKSPANCQSNSFKDPIDGGTCWTCPEGYKRTVLSVNGPKACEQPGGEKFKPATKHGKGKGLLGTDCDGGQFWDPNGNCYSCPNGYKRTAYPVTSPKACSQKVHASYKSATKVGEYGCDEGFLDLSTNKCWTCPKGYKRTTYSIKGDKACEKISLK